MNALALMDLLYKKGVELSAEHDELFVSAPDDVLNDELLALLKQLKPDVIALLKELNSVSDPAIIPHKYNYELSYDCEISLAQQRMLFMEELVENGFFYNLPVVYKITGSLNRNALRKSLSRLVAKHDVLRSVYVLRNNLYMQHVCQPADLHIIETSLVGFADRENILQAQLLKDSQYIFQLDKEWPIRVSLIEIEGSEYVLCINIHHIAADGWSARNIINEISAGYKIYHDAPGLQDVVDSYRDYQYADYVRWQIEWQKTSYFQDAKQYWISALKGAPELHSLPVDFTRPAIQSLSGCTYTQVFSALQTQQLQTCARAYKTTPFIILQAVFAAFLARYSGETDIVFGTVAANRQPKEFMDTVGLFVNTLVLRYAVADDVTFDALINQAVGVSEQAFRYQQLPFDILVDELQPARSLGYNPLVQIMLVMQEEAVHKLTLEGLDIVPLKQNQETSIFDIALNVYTKQNEFSIKWEYSTSLFRADTIAIMASHFAHLLESCLSASSRQINTIPLVDATAFFIDKNKFGEPSCIHGLFEQQALLYPDRIAGREGQNYITYKLLNEQADIVASHLFNNHAGNIFRIGLCVEKSIELLVGLLAILKVGGTYVPLDSSAPSERLEWIIEDSGINILLIGNDISLSDDLVAGVTSFSIQQLINSKIEISYHIVNDVDTAAYIIYTSGSTGKPKGVLVSHRSLFYSLCSNHEIMGITHTDVMPAIGSQAFDISLLEILLPLISGGEVQLLKKAQIADIEKLVELTNKVTVLHAVPSLMRQWLELVITTNNAEQYPNLRLLLIGGESVPDSLLREIKQWRPCVQLLELYGPTESAIVCSHYEVKDLFHAHHCIGRPHPHTYFRILNRLGQHQPKGVPGELYIGGLSLATEYVNQQQLTAENFIADPFVSGARLYKTGDYVRLLDDRNYEFLGRVDHQVSLRGVRIELGEIETLAANVDGVKQAIAHVVDLAEDERILVLYYTTDSQNDKHQELSEKVRAYLVQYLPDYMRPSFIQLLDALPLNINGKVDRKKLPFPSAIESIITPETDIEQRLVEIWMSVLKRDAISVTTNFFEIGGHSLMVSQLAIKIRAAFEITLPLTVLFEAPSIRACALYIEKALKEKYANSLIKRESDCTAVAQDEELII